MAFASVKHNYVSRFCAFAFVLCFDYIIISPSLVYHIDLQKHIAHSIFTLLSIDLLP